MASLLQFFFFGLCLSQIAAFGTNCGSRVINPSKVINDVHTRMQSDLKVAFLGDQNLGDNPKRVLKMIRDWGAHMVIHSGYV